MYSNTSSYQHNTAERHNIPTQRVYRVLQRQQLTTTGYAISTIIFQFHFNLSDAQFSIQAKTSTFLVKMAQYGKYIMNGAGRSEMFFLTVRFFSYSSISPPDCSNCLLSVELWSNVTSYGFSIPGTSRALFIFSSCAVWISSSRSSRNKSDVFSPLYSCKAPRKFNKKWNSKLPEKHTIGHHRKKQIIEKGSFFCIQH